MSYKHHPGQYSNGPDLPEPIPNDPGDQFRPEPRRMPRALAIILLGIAAAAALYALGAWMGILPR